jgi:hypothetical protein
LLFYFDYQNFKNIILNKKKIKNKNKNNIIKLTFVKLLNQEKQIQTKNSNKKLTKRKKIKI